MTSPPPHTSEYGTSLHRLVTPTARVGMAAAILITGLGISAVFWKMPKSSELHALCHEGIMDKNLATPPLPSESVAILPPEEQISFPMLDIAPVTDSGADKYTQVYPAPASLAIGGTQQKNLDVPAVEENETIAVPAVSQVFEPMRRIVVEKPIIVESVNRDFQSKPVSVSTDERNDELHSMFLFVENCRTDLDDSAEPADPFPLTAASIKPVLQPLQLLQYEDMPPHLPQRQSVLQPLRALTAQ